MSDTKTYVVVETAGPRYLGWRGQLLAELALARVPELVVTKLTSNGHADLRHDFLVIAPQGLCFFVNVTAFSSIALKLHDVAAIPELRCSVEAHLIRAARESRTPVFLFLFDADTDHGRYLRLDTLPEPEQQRLTLRLPVAHTISRESVQQLMNDL